MEPFVHLHNHTEFSALDGLQKMTQMMEAVKASGQTAVAKTDHGTLAGTLAFARAAAEAGVKAIAGEEIYMAIGDRDANESLAITNGDFEGSKTRRYYHLTVLAQNATGWRNIVQMHNESAQHVYYKPRANYDSLTRYGEGLILGTGCLGGPVASALLDGNVKGAYTATERLLEAVGGDKDRLFVELMNHDVPDEHVVIPALLDLARYFGLRPVVTNDAHYTHQHQEADHDLLLAIQTSDPIDAPKRFRFAGDRTSYYMRSFDEMAHAIRNTGIPIEALTNTQLIADMCDDNLLDILPQKLPPKQYRLPKAVPPADIERDYQANKPCEVEVDNVSQYWLWRKVLDGAKRRYPDGVPSLNQERLKYEFGVSRGFAVEDYWHLVEGITTWSHNNDILVGAGRGSGAGSEMAYCLDITDVPPIEYNLLFERFLDPTRVGMPDFDIDFPEAELGRLVRHMIDVYGHDYVARIGTLGSKLAKATIRDAGRLLDSQGTYLETSDQLARMILDKPGGGCYSIKDMLNPEKVADGAFRERVKNDPLAAKIVERAMPLDGISANPGIHACGIVISDTPITDVLPLRREDPKDPNSVWVTEWEGPDLESVDYLKFDRLGLRNLDVLQTCVTMLDEGLGEKINLRYGKLPLEGPRADKAWDMLAAGRTAGVFQLDSTGMTKLVTGIEPRNLEDVSAALALYRPGPMGDGMHDRFVQYRRQPETQSYDYLTRDPDEVAVIANVLDTTSGTICYQEQVMALAGDVAGFGPGQRNRLRKAISKKKGNEFAEIKERFMRGAVIATREGEVIEGLTPEGDVMAESRAFSEDTAARLWRTFEASAAYLFNKCITGDTVIYTGRGIGPKAETWTVEALWKRLYGDDTVPAGTCRHCGQRPVSTKARWCRRCDSWLRKFRDERGFTILAYSEADGRIRPARVADVHYNGEREVMRVTLADASSIKATGNHRFLTPDGYRTVDELSVGDELITHAGTSAIVSIEPAGTHDVYDVEMAEGTDHNFVANGIVSHNSHSVAYGWTTYRTAYLKANWPDYYAAALLACTGSGDKRQLVLNSQRQENVRITSPDVNEGGVRSAVSAPGVVRLGLAEVRDVGNNAAAIVQERDANGPFASLADLRRRVKVPISAIESLIDAGACDTLIEGERTRRAGMRAVARVIENVDLDVPDIEWPVWEKAERERHALGVIVTEHPMAAMGREVLAAMKTDEVMGPRDKALNPIGLHRLSVGERHWTCGVLSRWTIRPLRSGKGHLVSFALEGSQTNLEAVMFNRDLVDNMASYPNIAVGDIVGVFASARPRRAEYTTVDGETIVDESAGIELIANRVVPLDVRHADMLTPCVQRIPLSRPVAGPTVAEVVAEASEVMASSLPVPQADEDTQWHDLPVSDTISPSGNTKHHWQLFIRRIGASGMVSVVNGWSDAQRRAFSQAYTSWLGDVAAGVGHSPTFGEFKCGRDDEGRPYRFRYVHAPVAP